MNESLITPTEEKRLVILEGIITKGEQAFIGVGLALLEIRDKRLYRRDYKSFDQYVQAKWFKGKRWATRMISAAVVVEELPTKVGTRVPTEAAARELAKVPPESRVEVVENIPKSTPVTPRAIIKEAEVIIKKAKVAEEDDMGTVIPESALPIWYRRDEIAELAKQLTRVRQSVEQAHKRDDPLYQPLGASFFDSLSRTITEMRRARPEVVCGSCEGRVPKAGCATCSSTGFQSKPDYEHLIPEEDRNIRKKSIANRHNATTRLPAAVPRFNP